MKKYPFTITVCFVLFALTAVFAQTTPSGTSLTANPVFQKNCARCHGNNAQGRRFGGPSLLSRKTAATSAENLHNIIAYGKGHIPKFRMPKFGGKLTPEEIDGLVKQIQASNKRS